MFTHVTVVGAGALGRVYGVRLVAAGEQVSFVVREGRVTEQDPFVIERVDRDRRRDVLERPHRVVDVPAATSAVLVAVRFDQLDADPSVRERLLGVREVPIVMLTPLLPRQRASLQDALGRRIIPGMPSVSGYLDGRGVVRYWAPRIASTLLDAEAAAARPALEELARRLDEAGIRARVAHDVMAVNLASTVTFFPFIAAIGVAGGVAGMLHDASLLRTALAAARECEALVRELGKPVPWVRFLMRVLRPRTIKPAAAVVQRLSPEAFTFLDAHFGSKLLAQHVAMGKSIAALGGEHGQEMPALSRLVEDLEARRR